MSLKIPKTTTALSQYTKLFEKNPKLEDFKRFLVTHSVFLECEKAILSKVARPGGKNILSIIGPTGAGKTQLINEVATTILDLKLSPDAKPDELKRALAARPYLPVVCVTATTGRTYESRFKDLLLQILAQINGILVKAGKTTVEGDADPSKPKKSSAKSIFGISIASLEALVRSALKERKVLAVFIDEAQHLALGSNAAEWRLVGDGFKVLGSISGTLLVLFGTAELLTLQSVSGSVGRRSKSIHLRRYKWTDPADHAEFSNVVASFCEAWPELLPSKLLMNQLPLLYVGSCGCVGSLSDWLYESMSEAEQCGSPVVTLDILRKCASPEPRLRQIKQEAEACEISFANDQKDLSRLIQEMCPEPAASSCSLSSEPTVTEKQEVPEAKRRRKLKPGKRRQKYDDYKPQLVQPQLVA